MNPYWQLLGRAAHREFIFAKQAENPGLPHLKSYISTAFQESAGSDGQTSENQPNNRMLLESARVLSQHHSRSRMLLTTLDDY